MLAQKDWERLKQAKEQKALFFLMRSIKGVMEIKSKNRLEKNATIGGRFRRFLSAVYFYCHAVCRSPKKNNAVQYCRRCEDFSSHCELIRFNLGSFFPPQRDLCIHLRTFTSTSKLSAPSACASTQPLP